MPGGSALRVDKIIISRNEDVIRLLFQRGELGNKVAVITLLKLIIT